MIKSRSAIVLLIMLLGVVGRVAQAGLITFDELPLNTQIDGQTIDIVTFSFRVGGISSSDATVATAGPGVTPIFAPPNLEGERTGILGLQFATPVLSISYAFSLFDFITVPDGSSIQIFDAADSMIGSAKGDAIFGPNLPQGIVAISSSIPIASAEISFLQGSRFALDNLSYATVPEPSTLALLGLGIVGMGLAIRRKA